MAHLWHLCSLITLSRAWIRWIAASGRNRGIVSTEAAVGGRNNAWCGELTGVILPRISVRCKWRWKGCRG